jgi:hypothetical protein
MRTPGPEEWKQLIAEFETSGLSHKDFVAKQDVSLGTFQFWLYRTRRKPRTRSSDSDSNSTPRFLPVEVVASPAVTRAGAGDAVELGLRSGTVVRFPVGTDVRYLAELLSALG